MQHAKTTLETSSAVSYKHTHRTSESHSYIPTAMRFTSVSFIHLQRLETIPTSFSGNVWYIHTMAYCSEIIKSNQLLKHTTWMNFNCILTGFLNLATTDILGQIHLFCESCSTHCRTFGTTPNLYILEASSPPSPHKTWERKVSPDFVECPMAQNHPQLKTTALH